MKQIQKSLLENLMRSALPKVYSAYRHQTGEAIQELRAVMDFAEVTFAVSISVKPNSTTRVEFLNFGGTYGEFLDLVAQTKNSGQFTEMLILACPAYDNPDVLTAKYLTDNELS